MTLPRAKKSYGQNFLQDQSVIQKIIAAAEIHPGENVLEIGPGTGVLTAALIEAGATVTAVEADHDLIAPLVERFSDRIRLVEGDILSVPKKELPGPRYKLVANIPYNITSAVIQKFLSEEPRPSRLVLMVQREVADRIVAKPPDMSLLSVVCQLYADVKKVVNVPRGAFRPMPKVGSAVVSFQVTGDPREVEPIIALAKAGFSSPRKQLHHNLAASGKISSEQAKIILSELGKDPRARAETLTIDDWRAFGSKIGKVTHK